MKAAEVCHRITRLPYQIPTALSLGAVGSVLSGAIALSLVANRGRPAKRQPVTETDPNSRPVLNLR